MHSIDNDLLNFEIIFMDILMSSHLFCVVVVVFAFHRFQELYFFPFLIHPSIECADRF